MVSAFRIKNAKKTNDIEELAFEFNKCFNACKVLNPNISKQYYSDIFFNNLKNESVVFSADRAFYRDESLLSMIAKQLAVILNIEQVKYILLSKLLCLTLCFLRRY